ncbi:uncharacterized protein LOC123509149 [Portunus trituberculatus]|uniref:uncharacterized protein LOC123509149 n=1 Tax=Portunus trituberculatus TaxID=210409 RepID=UPI001E1CD261|nr:uncharacterized protein LOC123509149 [Portunus trituberculatus]
MRIEACVGVLVSMFLLFCTGEGVGDESKGEEEDRGLDATNEVLEEDQRFKSSVTYIDVHRSTQARPRFFGTLGDWLGRGRGGEEEEEEEEEKKEEEEEETSISQLSSSFLLSHPYPLVMPLINNAPQPPPVVLAGAGGYSTHAAHLPHLPRPPTHPPRPRTPVKVTVSLPNPVVLTETVTRFEGLLDGLKRQLLDFHASLSSPGGVTRGGMLPSAPHTTSVPPYPTSLPGNHEILVVDPGRNGEKYTLRVTNSLPISNPQGMAGWEGVVELEDTLGHNLGELHRGILGMGRDISKKVSNRVIEMMM